MSSRLEASRETRANCHRTRLIALAVGLLLYPALYTYLGLFPESSLARHVQPSPLIPEKITWLEVPETCFRLVQEISWLVFTEPLWDYTPAPGQRVGVYEGTLGMEWQRSYSLIYSEHPTRKRTGWFPVRPSFIVGVCSQRIAPKTI